MEKDKRLIILGTAHGENVAGKRSPDGKFEEWRYSRETVAALAALLKAEGFNVHVDIANGIVPGRQAEELAMRCRIVNELCRKWGTENCIYVSIHVNAAGNGSKWMGARGWSVYTSRGRTKADDLATCIWDAADELLPHDNKTALRKDMSDGDPDYEAGFYVLKNTKCAAVLTENLFMDNREDVNYLMSEEGRKTIVEIHRKGIVDYLENESK